MILGHYYWVRFKNFGDKFGNWQPGVLKVTNGIHWFGLCYNEAHWLVESFDVGGEILPPVPEKEKQE